MKAPAEQDYSTMWPVATISEQIQHGMRAQQHHHTVQPFNRCCDNAASSELRPDARPTADSEQATPAAHVGLGKCRIAISKIYRVDKNALPSDLALVAGQNRPDCCPSGD